MNALNIIIGAMVIVSGLGIILDRVNVANRLYRYYNAPRRKLFGFGTDRSVLRPTEMQARAVALVLGIGVTAAGLYFIVTGFGA